jgi:S1-C subfamily serine protease
VDGGGTTTIYEQSALAGSGGRGDGDGTLTARDIYKRDAPGVVYIRAESLSPTTSPFDPFGGTQDTHSTGSGFVLDHDGHVLTNAHVVDNATMVSVTFNGTRTRPAKIVGRDESTDLALLKVDTSGLHLRPLQLGDSKRVQVGDPTVAIGNPFGYDRTLTTGVVSALQRRLTAPDGYTIDNVIQTDAAINPGNSGGPLIDAGGRVIGINSQIATGGNGSGSVGIGFAVPVDTAKSVIRQLEEHGRVERAWLGIRFVAIDPEVRQAGVDERTGLLVQSVSTNGPAARAGLLGGDRPVTMVTGDQLLLGGDVVTTVDGTRMVTADDLTRVLQRHRPGDTVPVEVRRGDTLRTLQVTLGNRPAGGADS